MITSAAVKAHALELGFDTCGVAPVGPFPELLFLDEWLRRGYAGTMAYLGRSRAKRREVRAADPDARSVVVTATLYNTNRPYDVDVQDPGLARFSRYAWGDDYHVVVRQRLDALVEWMRSVERTPFEARTYVDTGPVQERVYAQYAGLGWIGKNTCLIDPELGSWLFLGCVICSLPLEADAPGVDQCGECTTCLSACPTGAIVEPWVLDATRCISYLTIELRSEIPAELRPAMGTRVYGCDICQHVCPWNQRAGVSAAPEWQPRDAVDAPRLEALWRMTDRALEAVLRGSAMERAGVVRLRRNLAIAIGNTAGALPSGLLDDLDDPDRPSLADPVVRPHIEWARERLANALPSGTSASGEAGMIDP